MENACNDPDWIKFLEEVLSTYSADNSTPAIDVNIMDGLHGTPLYFACELGNLDVVNVLLNHGANPNKYYDNPLEYVLRENKIDIADTLLAHGAKISSSSLDLIKENIIKYSCNTVERFLPHIPDRIKNKILTSIVYSDHAGDDCGIEVAKLLLAAGAKFHTEELEYLANSKEKSELLKLFNEYKEFNYINIRRHDSPQKRSLRKSWVIDLALLFGAIGVTLVVMGIIPEIVAIGAIATAVLSGVAGAIAGGIAGYLVDVAINQFCGSQQLVA